MASLREDRLDFCMLYSYSRCRVERWLLCWPVGLIGRVAVGCVWANKCSWKLAVGSWSLFSGPEHNHYCLAHSTHAHAPRRVTYGIWVWRSRGTHDSRDREDREGTRVLEGTKIGWGICHSRSQCFIHSLLQTKHKIHCTHHYN